MPSGVLAALALLWLNPKAWTIAVGASTAHVGLAPDPERLAALLALAFGDRE